MTKKVCFVFCLIGTLFFKVNPVKGQAALLVLIFGDKVATENFHFSLKAGTNIATQSGFEDTKRLNGFNFGLVSSIKLSKKWYFEPEFLPLSPKGLRGAPVFETGNSTIDPTLDGFSDSKRQLNYIDVPLMARYYVTEKWSVAAGPYIAYLSGATEEFKANDLGEVTLKTDVKSYVNTWDYGGVLELSYSLWEARKGKGLNIYARYSFGLAEVYKSNVEGSHLNSVWQFGAVLPFILVDD